MQKTDLICAEQNINIWHEVTRLGDGWTMDGDIDGANRWIKYGIPHFN